MVISGLGSDLRFGAPTAWDGETGRLLRQLPFHNNKHSIYHLCLSGDGRLLLQAQWEDVVATDLETGKAGQVAINPALLVRPAIRVC